MSDIVAISGSLRSRSLNTALIRAGRAVAPRDRLIGIESIHKIPLYDGDLESGPRSGA